MQTLEHALKFRTIGRYPVEIVRASTGQHVRSGLINEPRALPRLLVATYALRGVPAQAIYKVRGNDMEPEGMRVITDEQRAELLAEMNADDVPVIIWTE